MENSLTVIASNFEIEGTIENVIPFGEGHINQTFFVSTKEADMPDYILQCKNKNIFLSVPGMMSNIYKVTSHLKRKIIERNGDPLRESMTIIPTVNGRLFFKDDSGEYWTMYLFIKDNISYEVANTTELAYSGGKGVGNFQGMLSDFKEPLVDILPGFHNIRYRFNQWDSTLSKDPVGRKTLVLEEISWVESRRNKMLKFWELIEKELIPIRVTHNDTKINNILFDKRGEVLCVIDLDTVLNSTALNDFGDAIRSYTNTGLEDDQNLENVSMNIEIFEAFAKGYLEEAKTFLTPLEKKFLAFSAKYITYEQILRFLMDYIDGDNYYKVKYENHNLTRTRAQYKLLQSMEDQFDSMNSIIKKYS